MPVTKGIMGFVDLGTAVGAGVKLRVESAGLRAVQDITAMETIDSKYDYTAYRLGPVRIEGDISFPVPATSGVMSSVVKAAALRNSTTGQLATLPTDVIICYDDSIIYKYEKCRINTMSVTVNSEEAIGVTWSLIGTQRTTEATVSLHPQTSPERVLTWNDATISMANLNAVGSTVPTFVAANVKNFSFEINNNLTAFYGLNGSIYTVVNNIVAGKREVSGTIEAAWNGSGLQNYAYSQNTNAQRCSSNDRIKLDLTKCVGGESGTPTGSTTGLAVYFNGVIFNMEDISVTNDFFMGTQAWRAYGASGTDYKALTVDGTDM